MESGGSDRGGDSADAEGGCHLTTLKEFEEALREQGMHMALAVLQKLKERDRATRSISPARRIAGRKMTPDLARAILELHATTGLTQQEIAFRLGVNQGRVNEVIKHGKWLSDDPDSAEAQARDRAVRRAERGIGFAAKATDRPAVERPRAAPGRRKAPKPKRKPSAQLNLGDL
jgi:hypothetical protein